MIVSWNHHRPLGKTDLFEQGFPITSYNRRDSILAPLLKPSLHSVPLDSIAIYKTASPMWSLL